MFGKYEVRARAGRRVRVAVTLIGLVLVALVPMAPANAATTITISRGTVIGGESITVSGTLGQKKARPVVLQRKSGTSWIKVLAGKSTTAGAFKFTYKPPTKAGSRTVIRVIAPKVRISGRTYSQITTGGRTVLTAGQTAAMTAPSAVAQDATFTITGKFTPVRTGRTVVLQKPANGTWVGVKTTTQSSTGAVSFSMSLKAQGDFTFRVTALAAGGAPAVASAPGTVSVTMPVPTGLTATPGNAHVQLSWNAVTATELAGYLVYKRTDPGDSPVLWTKVTPNPISATSLDVVALTNGQPYGFTVTSVNGSGDESAFATKATATPVAPPDTTPPPVPTEVNAEPGNSSAQVSWSAVVDPGDLAGYNVYRKTSSTDWAKVTPSPIGATSFASTGLTNGVEYFFAVTSVDSTVPTANESAKSIAASATPAVGADTTPPPVPNGVNATPGNASAQLSWTAVVNPGDLAGYNVFQGPSASGPWTKLNGGPISATAYSATSLTNGTQYFFAVSSVDTNTPVANESANSTAAFTTPVAPPAGWSAVSAGLQHTCALGSDATLWCWGYNSDGQLGSNAAITSPTPSKVGIASNWTSVSAGDDSTCGVQSNGTLWCWGSNKYGQLGNNTNSGTNNANPAPLQVAGTSWASVSVGRRYACGRQTTGTVWCWGFNSDGQLGRIVGADPLADNPVPGQVGSATTWTSVSAGTDQACAVQSGGTLWCWGGNSSGQLGNSVNLDGMPTPTPTQVGSVATWSSVSAGEYHTCALQSSGAAFCFGSNAFGELGKAANANQNSAPSSAGTGWTSISAGGDHTCGTKIGAPLVIDGVYCFGRNQYAQLGKAANATANATAARVSSSTSAWTITDSGGASTCARTTANKVFCWGLNEFGQLGDPSTVGTTPNPTPFDVLVPAG